MKIVGDTATVIFNGKVIAETKSVEATVGCKKQTSSNLNTLFKSVNIKGKKLI
ncbi:hypothetical protein LAV82_22760 [Bacillus sp. ILBB4]|nr:hypothetical protein [Bacillus sp. ILBB4]